jgi:hypothetical protein
MVKEDSDALPMNIVSIDSFHPVHSRPVHLNIVLQVRHVVADSMNQIEG